MRKWCVTMAMGALLALPLCAQQKDVSSAETTNETSGSAATASGTPGDYSIAPASRTLFAMPAAPAPQPADIFSDWNNNAWNRHAWGLLTPKWEIAGMFQYLNFSPGSFQNFNTFGATGALTYNVNHWLGLTAEMGGYHFTRQLFTPNSDGTIGGTSQNISGSFETYLFGPRINFRHFDRFVPFVEFMAGAAHGDTEITGDQSQTSLALAAGGGLDIVIFKNVAWRFFQADYLMTNFNGSLLSADGRQNNFRIGTGVVIRWGYPPIPPKPNHPPVASATDHSR